MSLTALILEDETRAANVLKKMIHAECHEIDDVLHCSNLNDGLLTIAHQSPTISFVDINLPDGNGFELISKLQEIGSRIIITSADITYAIKAIRYTVSDFLLKPYTRTDLKTAINRALDKTGLQQPTSSKILLHTERHTHMVESTDIAYCKADGNYTRVVLRSGEEIVISRTLKHFEDHLNGHGFFRTHRSYLINMRFVKGIEKMDGGSLVLKDNSLVPISSRKKVEVLALIQGLSKCSF